MNDDKLLVSENESQEVLLFTQEENKDPDESGVPLPSAVLNTTVACDPTKVFRRDQTPTQLLQSMAKTFKCFSSNVNFALNPLNRRSFRFVFWLASTASAEMKTFIGEELLADIRSLLTKDMDNAAANDKLERLNTLLEELAPTQFTGVDSDSQNTVLQMMRIVTTWICPLEPNKCF